MPVQAVTIGELLFDIFPDGERLGGAPSNFAYHVAGLGGESHLVSAVGDDERGQGAVETLTRAGIDVSGVGMVAGHLTGTVNVSISDGQPTYEIVEDVAWDQIDIQEQTRVAAERTDLLCWGTLGQRSCRSREAHRQLFDLVPDDCLKVCDINFRMHYHDESVVFDSLRRADVVKFSDEEVPLLRSYVSGPKDVRDYLRDLRHAFGIDVIVMTAGSRGCRVSSPDVDCSVPGTDVDVVNTVGAGDAFAASFVLNLLSGKDLRSCAESANRLGAYVATQDSAMPELPEQLSA